MLNLRDDHLHSVSHLHPVYPNPSVPRDKLAVSWFQNISLPELRKQIEFFLDFSAFLADFWE
jgi:hypothetical protein